ncbi:outer membrane protein assembly factor BamA [Buchnera aphidicola (Macrosiphoniella sanborni)]|uniref:Outer membrane protein assembly factor BamA n=1 Tax=Buchnera aphidicola (Macrosiphoniella sanborni) TaxID=1241865 RepID=A0A4D6YHG2_9GAMM|nr:outer membrane protein assembly factor BamA [Buchnera aphidicola]QCI23785.1 outer membrane protein assembly factor BamA [Buchnera aphidicola (Macrosiphoniella sanborni)]
MLIKKFFITFLIFFSISSYAKTIDIINNIQFKGLKNVSQNEALKSIILNKENKISKYDIKKSIDSLLKTGKFEDIKAVYSKKNVVFYVREKPVISNITISGNTIIKNSILNSYLQKLNIKQGSVLNEFFINIFTKTIEDFYYNLGRFKSDIQVLKNLSEDNTVDLKIIINEGIITQINNIKILGITDFSKEKIFSLFESKDHPVWWNFLDPCIYSPNKLNQDLKNLHDFYLNHGYFYFHITDKTINFIQDKNQVDIIINISEGKKYRISKFFINGNVFPYQVLMKQLININSDEVYNREKIHNIIYNIKRFLSEHGYINSTIEVNPIVNHKTQTIVLDFNININKRFFVHRINFIGNTITQDKVLRREIKQIEGKYVNTSLIELGKKSLQNTKYFSYVEAIKKICSHYPNQVDIFYRVKEKPTGSINFGFGYGMDSGMSFNTSLSKNNIFGSGNSFKANIIKNNNQKYADISITYPYFMSNIKDVNSRFFYNDLKYNFDNVDNLIKKTYGLENSLGILINNFNKINIGFGYTHNGIKNEEKIIDVSNIKEKTVDFSSLKKNTVNDFTLNYSWIHSTLEYFYFPVSGNQMHISGKNTIPGSDNDFYKFVLDNAYYLPIDKKKDFIFLSHIHAGIGNIFNKEKFPFYENFYANSENNIRGFRLNTIGPKKSYNISDSQKCLGNLKNNICESINSIGGNLTFTSNLEVITPIPFIDDNYSKLFRTSLFFDIGNIWDTSLYNYKEKHIFSFLEHNILNNIYSSVGFSLQWFSPIGPLVFSYSFPMQKDKNYQLEPFQFNFGKNW